MNFWALFIVLVNKFFGGNTISILISISGCALLILKELISRSHTKT